ncbi:C-C motif chemokine 4-like [Parambassis ranga]|uniref:C-C motif chemokine 4-like n=1 Tax=Parambassis ranga TaxID=210632 RepID=A0A6P7KCI4_9TELE|nr:C-C motif chemokine 4-like [Parambassis ranga]
MKMAAPRLALSVFVLLLAAVALTEAVRGIGPKKCCFAFHKNPVKGERVESYIKTSQRCSNPAVLLKMVTGKQLCVRPSDSWVKEIINKLDNRVVPGSESNI